MDNMTSPTARVRRSILSSVIDGLTKRRISEVREVVVTRTIALMVDMAAERAARSIMPSKPLGSMDLATKGTKASEFFMKVVRSWGGKTP